MTESAPVRVRFAPSPTGHLHVGGARTAIFNWLFARHHRGSFILRVEDTDQQRSTRESEQMVLGDLRWLGLDWDEGPEVGGSLGPYRQSERRAVYDRVAKTLLFTGRAYRCFCSEEELERKRKLTETAGGMPHYDLTCFRLSADEVSAKSAAGRASAIRFHVPKEEGSAFSSEVTIHDLIRGEVSWQKESLGDFILVRSDGMPTYNFSVVVDDHEMEISHVIRAEEHLTNTHRQVLIYRALGWEVPKFAHVSLILGEDRSKLSKRHGATSVSAYAEQGFLSQAMVNYLTLLGWSSPEEREVFPPEHAVEHFTLERVNDAPAIFDKTKFTWLNGQHIQNSSGGALLTLLEEPFRHEGWISAAMSEPLRAWLEEAIDVVKKGRQTLLEFVPALRFFFSHDPAHVLAEHGPLLGESRLLLLALAQQLDEDGVPLDPDHYHALSDRLKTETGLKGKNLFMPIRIALTGSDHGPDLQRTISLMERAGSVEGLATVMPPRERIRLLLSLLET